MRINDNYNQTLDEARIMLKTSSKVFFFGKTIILLRAGTVINS